MFHFRNTGEVLRVQYSIPKVAAMVLQEAAEKTQAKQYQIERELKAQADKLKPSKAKENKEGHLIFEAHKCRDSEGE